MTNHITDLLTTNGWTIMEQKTLHGGIRQYRLQDGCIVCQTSSGHIDLQVKRNERVADLFASEMPLECLAKKEADKRRRDLFLAAKNALLGVSE